VDHWRAVTNPQTKTSTGVGKSEKAGTITVGKRRKDHEGTQGKPHHGGKVRALWTAETRGQKQRNGRL